MSEIKIREIKKEDNLFIAGLIKSVLVEFGAPKVGTAYEDEALLDMYATYLAPNKSYFVLEENGIVLGGAGIAPLQNGESTVCELQKMYFSSAARGKGFGQQLMQRCLEAAAEMGYEKCYLETMPYMIGAQKLYKKSGFVAINNPLGDTGHYSCTTYMLKVL